MTPAPGRELPEPRGVKTPPNKELVAWLRRSIEERDPAAAIRFGDAEARLLSHDLAAAEPRAVVLEHLTRESGRELDASDALELRVLVREAFDGADVLGIQPRARATGDHAAQMERLADLNVQRTAGGRPAALLADCMLGHRLIAELPKMLAGRRVSVISCRDVKPVLDDWGVADVAVYQIPSQYEARLVDGTYEAAMHGVPIWPDRIVEVEAELAVREPGEVFLIGAGIFGKHLAIRVRERGGIALDMGSALDRLAGRITRGPRYRVIDQHAAGLPASEIATRLQPLLGVRLDENRISDWILEVSEGEIADWQRGPLEPRYTTTYIDTVEAEIANGQSSAHRSCAIALGAVGKGTSLEPLGIWWQNHWDAERWSEALADLRRRGVRSLSIACREEMLSPLAKAIRAVFADAPVSAVSDPIAPYPAVRCAVERHGAFPNETAATALIHLALKRAESIQVSHAR